MSMNKFLETYDIKDVREYCQNRCIKIVSEHLNYKKEHLPYFRGNYKGYLYGIKICNALLKQRIIIKRYQFYNHLKLQQQRARYNCTIEGGFNRGLTNSFYDLMNYVSVNYIEKSSI